ncbi:unannotated protein [freshwater metagenome]|uniref:Unannotated protein n=1 Tax=freshwater metagenome TaxID=449393 RepID=A0A6J7UIH5_9ZZZZ
MATSPTFAPRAPGSADVVASGIGGRFAALRASVINSAVLVAVPLGASALFGWCNSIISTDSKCFAACAANCIINTAPSPKLGAISAPTFAFFANSSFTLASLALSKPVVPTTTFIPLLIANSKLAITESGCVKSTTTSAPLVFKDSIESPRSKAATSSRSVAAFMVATVCAPIFPFAPSTPTFIIGLPFQILSRSYTVPLRQA